MYRISNRIILLIIASLSLISCDKWLDGVKQTSTVSDEIVWDEESSIDKYVNGFYINLFDYGQFGDAQFSGSLTESLTDSFKYGSYTLGHRAGHPNNYVLNPDAISADNCLYCVWRTDAYTRIRQINQFLRLQKEYSKFPESNNQIWAAQARFFRAFVYFQLARRHGGVILYDDLPTDGQKAISSEDDTWQFISEDLDYAASYLPEEWDKANAGRVTKGAAYALKSRVMLYAKRWQEAYDASQNVIKLNRYALEQNYENAWKGGNRESILEFDFNLANGPTHKFDQYYVPQCDGYDFGSLGTPTQEMVESYETAAGAKVDWTPWHGTSTIPPPYDELEPRFKATIIYRGAVWKGRVMDCSVDGVNGVFMKYREQSYSYGKTVTGYFLKKLLDENISDIKVGKSTQPWVEIRYAEVLLNKAEAAYRLNNLSEARGALNEVRARVGLPAKNSEGEEFFKDYRNERKVELAYEGHLFWDMRRWKLAHLEYNNYRVHGMKIIGATGTYEYVDCDYEDRKFLPKQYILPVPSSELKNNSLAIQYPEWK